MPSAPPRMSMAPKRRSTWGNATKRVYVGRPLQRERARLFADEPLCRECKKAGRYTIATIRDHIKALAFGGLDTRENTQPLCQACSDVKTKRESSEGLRRSRA